MSRLYPCILAVLVAAASCDGGDLDRENDDDTTDVPTETVFPSGVPTGPETTATIGPEGGTVASEDGMLQLTIGPGALAEPTTIGIQAITNTAPGGFGTAYRLSPSGTTFAIPVQLTFELEEADLQGTDALSIGFQDHEGLWWEAPESDVQLEPEAHAISVSTTHFSDWSRLSGLQLRPPEKTLREGETLTLTAVDCQAQYGDEENLPSLMSLCSIDAELPPLPGFVQEWAVDGIPGGSEGVGTITAGDRPDQAIYTAPEFAVGVERHTVSAKMRRRNGGTVLLVSNITVTGAFTFQLSGFYSAEQSHEACQLVPSSVSDRVDAVIAPSDGGIYTVEDITNHTTTYVLGSLPPVDPGTIRLDTPPEHLTATDGSVLHVQGTDAIGITLTGTNLLGGCTYTVDDQSIELPSMSMEGGVGVTFRISDLVDGSLVLAEYANWSWTITQIQ